MNIKSLKILSWLSLIIGLIIFLSTSIDKTVEDLIICILISAMYSFVIGVGNGLFNDYLNQRYSWVYGTKTRVIVGIIGIIVINFFLVYLCNFINLVLIQDATTVSGFFTAKYNLINWIVVNFALLVSSFLHAKGFVDELKKTSHKQVVEQKIIATSANAQFESLKNQLDPHFLFNSLNVLSSLIDENPTQAQKFTTSMSKIYRYVLEQKDKELVTIEEEIDFAKIYADLLKTRFEDSVNITFNISDDYRKFWVVPLSLQLLLENCIKHNFATAGKPLEINLFIENDFLCIENNLQVREQFVDRDGIGLSNIVQRYALLTDANVFIEKSESFFKVKIPIIKEYVFNKSNAVNKEEVDDLAYAKAQERVKEIKSFYINLIMYCILMPVLIVLNVISSPSHLWFFYPMLGWGLGLLAHGFSVYPPNIILGKNWEEKKIKELINKNT